MSFNLPTTTDPVQWTRQFWDNLWATALNNTPWVANPNLRTGFTVSFQVLGLNSAGATALVPAGYTVAARLNSASSGPSGIVEGSVIQSQTGITNESGTVSLTFSLILDVSQYYQIDLTVTDLTGNSQTFDQAVLLNPQPGSDWGGLNGTTFIVTSSLGGSNSSTPTSATVTVSIQLFNSSTGAGMSGASVQYLIYPQGGDPAQAISLASGTTNSSGSYVQEGIAVTLDPATNYVRILVVNGTSYTIGNVNGVTDSAEPGSSIIAQPYLSTTWSAAAGASS